MALTVPNAPARILYNTSKRVVDELGKGQEMLRTEGRSYITDDNDPTYFVIMIPEVDIEVVGARMLCGGTAHGDDNAEIVVPQNTNDLNPNPAAGNRLVSQVTDPSAAEDVVVDLTLAGLNANIVRAGQPIVGVYTDDAGSGVIVYLQVSYILVDEERTF